MDETSQGTDIATLEWKRYIFWDVVTESVHPVALCYWCEVGGLGSTIEVSHQARWKARSPALHTVQHTDFYVWTGAVLLVNVIDQWLNWDLIEHLLDVWAELLPVQMPSHVPAGLAATHSPYVVLCLNTRVSEFRSLEVQTLTFPILVCFLCQWGNWCCLSVWRDVSIYPI